MADTDGIVEFEERRKRSLPEWVDSVEQEARRGHKALREDFRTFADENAEALELMRDATNTIRNRVDLIERTPQDVMKLRFSTSVVVAIAITLVTFVGSAYGIGTMVMGRINALSTQLNQAVESQKTERETTTKLQDERAARLSTDIAAIKAQQTMQDLRLTNLREMLLNTKR